MATGGELILPVLLVLGLGTRFCQLRAFYSNAVAAIFLPDISPAGINDHFSFGGMAAVLVVYGPGWLSLDQVAARKLIMRDKADSLRS